MKTPGWILTTSFILIAAITGSPLAGAGKPNRPPPPPPPTEPPARAWHGFTGNGSTAPEVSRLYLFGGAGSDYQPLSDLWRYRVTDAQWTLAPVGRIKPGGRQHMGFSCGAGLCVAANGSNGVSVLKETWVFTEESDIWSQLNCKYYLCPSARQMLTMAYDSARNYHLLFGGVLNWTYLDDTYTFSNSTQLWTRQNPRTSPSARRSAAAAFVAGPLNRVVLLGGQNNYGRDVLCDMWSWTGTTWEEVDQINGPCLHSHSMAWDGGRLVVTGGYVDTSDTANDSVWTFTFAPDGKAGTWSYYPHWSVYFNPCTGAPAIHPGAFMAYDRPSGKMVFFGGEENISGAGEFPYVVRYGDTTVCD